MWCAWLALIAAHGDLEPVERQLQDGTVEVVWKCPVCGKTFTAAEKALYEGGNKCPVCCAKVDQWTETSDAAEKAAAYGGNWTHAKETAYVCTDAVCDETKGSGCEDDHDGEHDHDHSNSTDSHAAWAALGMVALVAA